MRFTKLAYFLILLAFLGCRKKPNYPDEPVITFKSFDVMQDSAVFTFSFTDGDGNIGLKEGDTTGVFSPDTIFYYNVFLEYYEFEGGAFVKRNLFIPFYYRTPYIEPEGKDKWLEGDISVTITPFYYDFTSPRDTFMYTAQLVDRAQNLSNIIETPAMIKP